MAKWINVLQTTAFTNPLLCEKTGALATVKPDLTVGRPAGRQAGRPLGRGKCCTVRNFNSAYLTF